MSFMIIPTDPAHRSDATHTDSAADVFNVMVRLNCGEADITTDGAYSFSLRLNENNTWVIFQRHQAAETLSAADSAALDKASVAADERAAAARKSE
jgi:hypothetical protein